MLTAVKIELELDGRHEAGALVGRALNQVRDLSNLLRPAALDDLGLLGSLRALADDFAARTRIQWRSTSRAPARRLPPELEVVIYRVVQEALTNVARHARATDARVRLVTDEHDVRAHGRGQRPRHRRRTPARTWAGSACASASPPLGGQLAIGARRRDGGSPRRADSAGRGVVMARPVRVLLADDHTLVRSGIRRILEAQPGFEVVGEAADGAEALSTCARRRPPTSSCWT